MKTVTSLVILLFVITNAISQSKSYELLKEKFRGHENVFSFHTSGFLTRTVLLMAGETDINDAIRDVRTVHVTVVPKKAFRMEKVSVEGFIKKAKEDAFEELAHISDPGEDLTILMQTEKRKKYTDHRYLLLVENNHEVVALEITGYIDHELLLRKHKRESHHHYRKI